MGVHTKNLLLELFVDCFCILVGKIIESVNVLEYILIFKYSTNNIRKDNQFL